MTVILWLFAQATFSTITLPEGHGDVDPGAALVYTELEAKPRQDIDDGYERVGVILADQDTFVGSPYQCWRARTWQAEYAIGQVQLVPSEWIPDIEAGDQSLCDNRGCRQ